MATTDEILASVGRLHRRVDDLFTESVETKTAVARLEVSVQDSHRSHCAGIERHERLLLGSNGDDKQPGLKVQVDRHEQTLTLWRKGLWAIWSVLGTVVASLLAWFVTRGDGR